MARVLTPVMQRRYDFNPRGSATATVVMKGNNPFEQRSHLVNSQLASGALPGMSGLGNTPAPAAPAPAPATDWNTVAQQLAQAAIQVGGTVATGAINQHYAPNQRIPAVTSAQIPVVNANYNPQPRANWAPWAIGGAVLVGGVGLLLLMRRK